MEEWGQAEVFGADLADVYMELWSSIPLGETMNYLIIIFTSYGPALPWVHVKGGKSRQMTWLEGKRQKNVGNHCGGVQRRDCNEWKEVRWNRSMVRAGKWWRRVRNELVEGGGKKTGGEARGAGREEEWETTDQLYRWVERGGAENEQDTGKCWRQVRDGLVKVSRKETTDVKLS